ncbi:hypothetical protein [Cobetia amphilecti]|uniref:hypothetical protein n=1 Tax=Cobetia amphilecti TaxID=1055104 RepID=UPI00244D7947|nr:hypothetical protein [Cobetia litoralis]MDH2423739.1 hypothetical protein [Cobetia litoralis]
MKIFSLLFSVAFLSACASHQYDSMQMNSSKDGIKYSLDSDTLTVQYQKYQFIPNTVLILKECRKSSVKVADELDIEVSSFDYVTERNELLGITSCLAFGELKRHKDSI